jgi:hypothetical protein
MLLPLLAVRACPPQPTAMATAVGAAIFLQEACCQVLLLLLLA